MSTFSGVGFSCTANCGPEGTTGAGFASAAAASGVDSDWAVTGAAPEPPPTVDFLLGNQLESLKSMYSDRSRDSVEQNFLYAVYRSLNLMEPPRLPTEFGMSRIAPPERLVAWILKRLSLASNSARTVNA